MKINKENYGQFIVDYYDGQLSPAEERLLLLFLDRHPALKNEFKSFEKSPVLPDTPMRFAGKQALKRPEIVASNSITEDNYTEYFVLLQDGELTIEEQQTVKTFLQQNPYLQEEFRQFGLTKVVPDETIVYAQKEQLKKRMVIPMVRYAGIAAAAMLLLFFGIRFFLSTPGQNTESRQLALEGIPLKTTEMAVTEIPFQIIRKKFFSTTIRPEAVKKNISVTIRKPVEMLASADIYRPLKIEKDYAPLLFPDTREKEEIMALSLPVVVEKPKRYNFLRHTIGRPFSQFAAVLALQRKKRKMSRIHDKGFVKVLQSGVEAINALTDNDMVMVKTYNANGKLIDYQLLSDNISINRPVKNSR